MSSDGRCQCTVCAWRLAPQWTNHRSLPKNGALLDMLAPPFSRQLSFLSAQRITRKELPVLKQGFCFISKMFYISNMFYIYVQQYNNTCNMIVQGHPKDDARSVFGCRRLNILITEPERARGRPSSGSGTGRLGWDECLLKVLARKLFFF